MRSSPTRGRLATLGVAWGFLLAPARSWADSVPADEPPCVVRVMPADVAGDWRRAGLELRNRIRHWPAPDRDCRDLLIEVTPRGALLTITTSDGRQARRLVATPSALIPAASALAVSVQPASPPPSSDDASVSEASAVKEPERTTDRVAVLFLGGGLRVGAPGVFWAPVIRGAAALEVGPWEFGTYADWAPQYWLAANEVPPKFTMWSLSSGITAGRREPVGGLDLLAGVMFGASFVHQQSTTEEIDDGTLEIDEDEGDGVDLQIGSYLGLATPRSKSIRFRAQIELALPLSHPGRTREIDSDLPPLPGWSLMGVLGAEFGAP